MPTIFEQLLIQKIEKFISEFNESRILFYDDKKERLIHPGEYGIYREKVCREFLKSVVPGRLDFGTGFLMNSHDAVSTQCDIIIYDSKITPLIQDNELQTFYPIECVAAVGEIKSKVSKTNFIKALRKLSEIKKMREGIQSSIILYSDPSRKSKIKFDPVNYPYDMIFSFLICEEFEFDLTNTNLENFFDSVYKNKDIPNYLRHNLILSIKDGLICYHDGEKDFMYPINSKGTLENRLVNKKDEYFFFKLFASYIFLGISSTTLLYPEMNDYMDSIDGGMSL